MVKIVVNSCYGGFSLSESAFKELGKEWDGYGFLEREADRSDPALVACVEKLGDAANGRCARLRIVEIPDDVDWEINEYDGMESVREKSREWFPKD